MRPRSRRAKRPRLDRSSRPRRAQGRPDARCTRGLVCNGTRKCAHEHTGPAESIRPSLRNGLTAYGALSPETNSFCLRHRRIDGFARPGWARENLRRFDTSHGCQNHTLLPYAASFTNPSNQPLATGRSFGRGVLAPFVYTLSIAHGKPPCEHACAPNAAASTAPHPNVS
jgi:hypothetical protein